MHALGFIEAPSVDTQVHLLQTLKINPPEALVKTSAEKG